MSNRTLKRFGGNKFPDTTEGLIMAKDTGLRYLGQEGMSLRVTATPTLKNKFIPLPPGYPRP